MKSLEDIFYQWLLDYMAPENADQLSALLANETKRYCRYQYLAGLLTGVLVSVILYEILR